jgi:hypothetical protein
MFQRARHPLSRLLPSPMETNCSMRARASERWRRDVKSSATSVMTGGKQEYVMPQAEMRQPCSMSRSDTLSSLAKNSFRNRRPAYDVVVWNFRVFPS